MYRTPATTAALWPAVIQRKSTDKLQVLCLIPSLNFFSDFLCSPVFCEFWCFVFQVCPCSYAVRWKNGWIRRWCRTDGYRAELQGAPFDHRYCHQPSRGGERRRRRARLESFDPEWLSDCTVEDLFKYDHAGWAPIHYVAFNGHYEAVKAIVSGVPQQIDLRTADNFNATPLMLAAMGNRLSIVRLLLEHGADISAVDRSAVMCY